MKIEDLEDAVKKAGLRPLHKIERGNHTIYLAESDLETNSEYPFGFYQTAWFVAYGNGLQTGRPLNFKRDHDADQGWTETERREKRLEAALLDAEKWIADGKIS